MFTPFSGPILELHFLETYISCIAGAIFSSAIFYFSASYFMRRAHEKRVKQRLELEAKGVEVKKKKVFTRANKMVVRMKRSIGIIGISFWAPFFLSIPVGSIIAAKFYGHDKRTFILICTGILLNGVLTTGIAYLSYG